MSANEIRFEPAFKLNIGNLPIPWQNDLFENSFVKEKLLPSGRLVSGVSWMNMFAAGRRMLAECRLSITEEIKSWLLSFCRHAQILKAAGMVEELRAEHLAAVEAYYKPTAPRRASYAPFRIGSQTSPVSNANSPRPSRLRRFRTFRRVPFLGCKVVGPLLGIAQFGAKPVGFTREIGRVQRKLIVGDYDDRNHSILHCSCSNTHNKVKYPSIPFEIQSMYGIIAATAVNSTLDGFRFHNAAPLKNGISDGIAHLRRHFPRSPDRGFIEAKSDTSHITANRRLSAVA